MASSGLRESPRTRVAKQLQNWIRHGVLELGQRLPAERVLAEQLGASRVTIRAALKELEGTGLIRSTVSGARQVSRQPEGHTSLSGAIVVVGELMRPDAMVSDPGPTGWHMSIQMGAMTAAHAARKSALVISPDQFVDKVAATRLARERPAGVAFINHSGTATSNLSGADVLAAAGVPVVAYGYEEECPTFNTIGSDQQMGAYCLTHWLIEQGRRRILCIAPSSAVMDAEAPAWFRRRRLGQEQAIAEAGLALLPTVTIEPNMVGKAPDSWDNRAWTRVAAGYLVEFVNGPEAPDAIMAPSDGPAATVVEALRLLGKDRDVMVTGYDNYWHSLPAERRITPIAATVDKHNFDIGTSMIEMILDRAGRGVSGATQVEHRVVPPRLVTL